MEQEIITAETRHWDDIGVTIDCIVYSHYMKFEVFEHDGRAVDGQRTYHTKYGCNDYTENTAKAAIFLEGSIKWDGCSDMYFAEQEGVSMHFCGKRDLENVGKLLMNIWNLGGELIPSADEDFCYN